MSSLLLMILHMYLIQSVRCKAIFVDTDAVSAKESRLGDLIQNEGEAKLVHYFTEALLSGGVLESQIGIISLYRQQVKILSHLLKDRKGVEILTADRSQGRDKECIIISLVRSNDENHVSITNKSHCKISEDGGVFPIRLVTFSRIGAGSTSHSPAHGRNSSSLGREGRFKVRHCSRNSSR